MNPLARRLRHPGLVLAGWLALACPSPGGAADDFSKVEIQTTKVAGNVYMLAGEGGNIGVSAGPDGLLIVDDEFAPLADKIRAALKPLSPGKLHFILNTHWHGDHTGGNVAFGPEAPIVAHASVRKRLAEGSSDPKRPVPPAPGAALPVVTFDDRLSVHFNGEEIQVVHFPHGHTDGDSIIFFTGSNVVHMGDQLFNHRFPFIDLASGGDVVGYADNLEAVIAKIPPDAKIIPGHGPLATVDDVRASLKMIRETVALVKKEIAEGKDLTAIQKQGVPEEWKGWAWEFIGSDRWLENVHQSLTRTGGGK